MIKLELTPDSIKLGTKVYVVDLERTVTRTGVLRCSNSWTKLKVYATCVHRITVDTYDNAHSFDGVVTRIDGWAEDPDLQDRPILIQDVPVEFCFPTAEEAIAAKEDLLKFQASGYWKNGIYTEFLGYSELGALLTHLRGEI